MAKVQARRQVCACRVLGGWRMAELHGPRAGVSHSSPRPRLLPTTAGFSPCTCCRGFPFPAPH